MAHFLSQVFLNWAPRPTRTPLPSHDIQKLEKWRTGIHHMNTDDRHSESQDREVQTSDLHDKCIIHYTPEPQEMEMRDLLDCLMYFKANVICV
jgi:hypothetical protein